jgi:regulatory protein YycI of two-component signal transduction system YycFG
LNNANWIIFVFVFVVLIINCVLTWVRSAKQLGYDKEEEDDDDNDDEIEDPKLETD